MLIGFLLAYSITDRAWKKFQTHPTFTSMLLDQSDKQIAYPTVSVCPKSVVDFERVSEIIGSSGIKTNDTQEIEDLLRAIPIFTYGAKGLKSVVLSETVRPEVDQLLNNDIRALAFKLVKTCSDFLKSCRFKKKLINCCDAFQPVYTEHGFCYAFNSRIYSTPHDE